MAFDDYEYPDKTYTVLTTLLTAERVAHLDLVRNQPVLLQRFLRKASEVRVTCVGRRQFPVRISGQDFEEMVDWRRPDDFQRLRYEPCVLPTRSHEVSTAYEANCTWSTRRSI